MPSRIAPPSDERLAPHADVWEAYEAMMGFVPESSRTMARVTPRSATH